jgi:hypothetical protein
MLLWDFGDTLVDERWMRRAPAEFPDWADAWNTVMETCADDWNIGRACERDVFAEMSRRTGLSIDFVATPRRAVVRSPFIRSRGGSSLNAVDRRRWSR